MARFAALRIRVAAFVDLAHPARSDQREDFLRAETSAGDESQTPAVDYTGGTASETF
jgi:hypothetical protein